MFDDMEAPSDQTLPRRIAHLDTHFFLPKAPGNALEHPLMRSLNSVAAC